MPGPFLRFLLRVILSGACLAACAGNAVEAPTRKAQEIPPQMIYLGMKEDLVAQRMGPPFRVVGTKEYRDGVIEVRHYIVNRVNYMEDTASKKEFYLYFWNRELVRWDRPDEWEAEVDRIHDSMLIKRQK